MKINYVPLERAIKTRNPRTIADAIIKTPPSVMRDIVLDNPDSFPEHHDTDELTLTKRVMKESYELRTRLNSVPEELIGISPLLFLLIPSVVLGIIYLFTLI